MKREIIELREVITKLVPMLTAKKVVVTQRGSRAYVSVNPRTRQPERVNIPNVSDTADASFIRAIQGFIDHEVAHVLLTNWKDYLVKGDAHDVKNKRLQDLVNIVEDTMIEREIVKIFPGSLKNIADLRKHFVDKITKPAMKLVKGDDKQEFRILLVPLMRALAGHVEFQAYMNEEKLWDQPIVKAFVDALPETLKKALPKFNATKQCREAAELLEKILYPAPPPPPPAPKADPEPKKEESEEGGDGPGEGKKPHGEDSEEASGGESGEAKDAADGGAKAAGKPKGKTPEKDIEVDAFDDEASSDDEPSEPTDEDEDDDFGDPLAGMDHGMDDDEGYDAPPSDPDGEDDGDVDDELDDGDSGSGSGDTEEDADGAEDEGESSSGRSHSDEKRQTSIDEEDPEGDSENEGGVGNGAAGTSVFDHEFNDEDFSDLDLSSKMADEITKGAVRDLHSAPYTVFTREFDRIEPLDLKDANIPDSWVPKMESEVRSMVGRMQKDIERMMASQSHVMRIPGHRSGRLHAPGLHRLTTGDDRVFYRKLEHHSKDTAVTLLIDISGSMVSNNKIATAMVAAYALSTTLERVSIAHEMLGFTTAGYGALPRTLQEAIADEARSSGIRWARTCPIIMPIYKGFDERVTSEVKKRVAYQAYARPGMFNNVDGECVEYAALRLIKRQEKRKVMLVLSDGQPAGANHSDERHLMDTVKKVEKMGIDLVGIGIMDASVSKYYPNNVVLRDVAALPGEVMKRLKAILS
ncbi:cobaltochelatase CobT-related protein [Phyllobacterium myrsinacearum]|uniref:Cobalamin biosynthesis protein CobT n=1 Tax=Phyllobacterium myrsinacearum TaxID=28101 RepID=A0A839EUA9_9HYPH|nr:hypothetical protein [Phyllobacterium myrsinacearum]MBA8881768.1 cobalamin biosynthesis protein CobT [Phyllobacterium myrsinacearum]